MGIPYLGITGIPGLGIAGIPELGIAGIQELGIIIKFQTYNLTRVLYVHRFFFYEWGREKNIGVLRPLYLTTQTLRIFSTWSFELGTSSFQTFARSCVTKTREG